MNTQRAIDILQRLVDRTADDNDDKADAVEAIGSLQQAYNATRPTMLDCPGCGSSPRSTAAPGYCTECQTIKVYGPHTRAQLHAAFELCKPAQGWKYPIDTILPKGADLEAVDAAITFYCGGGTVFKMHQGGHGETVVTAPGYYKVIGA